MEIEILFDEAVISRATIGGVVDISNYRFGMTVRHAFKIPEAPEDDPQEVSVDDGPTVVTDFENDIFDSDPEEADDDDDGGGGGDDGDPKVDATENDSGGPDTNTMSDRTALIHRAEAFGQLIKREAADDAPLVTHDSRFDWALKKMTGVPRNRYFSNPSKNRPPERIEIKTPSQLIQGSLESSGIFGIHNVCRPQPVLVASTPDAAARPGESGSWVMRLKDGAFVGMLLGSFPSMSNAYILRMSDILDDIHRQTGLRPTVSALQNGPGSAWFQQCQRGP